MIELPDASTVDSLTEILRRDGVVILPPLLDASAWTSMRLAFESRLKHLRFNTVDGYEITEPYRDVVENVLLLDQGYIDIALHPIVLGVLTAYLGHSYVLAEAKGWRSRPTRRDFHGWHSDAWYDQSPVSQVVPEVKLGIYLTDVRSGAFNYLRGTHGHEHPRIFRNDEIERLGMERFSEVRGPAGTAFLFDTTGVHRQGVPMLQTRHAVFYCYHDAKVQLQPEDAAYNRYHPLLLNAAFLGGLTAMHQRVLGFGDTTNLAGGFVRSTPIPAVHRLAETCLRAALLVSAQVRRVIDRLAK